MNTLSKYWPLILSLLLYALLWKVLQPVLGYNLDSDCVAYLTIAERVANGEYLKSINGLWSPLNSWLVALFVKNGLDAWTSAKLLNFIFGAVLLIQGFFLFLKFKLNKYLIFYLQIALSIAMAYFVYFQMFGDILQLIFVLAYLFVLWHGSDRTITYPRAILSGIIIGIAFYAKAYSFFFFGIHFLITLLWYVYYGKMQMKTALPVYMAGIFFAIVTMLPWTFALHKKYGEWSLNGHAGKLNMSWYINSGKSFNPHIKLLIPPSYDDSPSFWEDPYLSQQDLSSPFSSATHFVKWIFRIAHTCLVAIFCFQEISFLGIAILVISVFCFFFVKRKEEENTDENFSAQLLILTICVLPAGYLMMHIETRYIWLNVFLLMIAGGLLLGLIIKHVNSYLLKHAMYFILAFSFAIFPILQFENLKYKNKDLFDISKVLNEKFIKGKFTSNISDAGRMWVVAYLTNSHFYTIEQSGYTSRELMDEMKRYDVKYYFYESENNISNTSVEGMKKIMTYHDLEIFERVD